MRLRTSTRSALATAATLAVLAGLVTADLVTGGGRSRPVGVAPAHPTATNTP